MSPAPREAGLEVVVLQLLGDLGWAVTHGPDIAPGEAAAERDDYRQVVLPRRLRAAVVRLNPRLPLDAVEDVLKTALRPESQVAESENWRAYRLLIEGVSVDYREPDGSIRSARARLMSLSRGLCVRVPADRCCRGVPRRGSARRSLGSARLVRVVG